MRHGGARDIHDAPEIRVDLSSEFIGDHLLKCADEAVAGVVNEDVNVIEGLKSLGDGALGLIWHGEVELYRAKAVTVGFGEINQLCSGRRAVATT
jgi:hypothetical protein